jgi:uncharacterized protein YukE
MAERGFPDLSVLLRVADFLGIPYDPVLPVLNTVYGDPGSLEGEAARLRKVQSNIMDASDLLRRNLNTLKLHWSGDACAAFETYVTSMTEKLDHLSNIIGRVVTQLGQLASNIDSMWRSIAEPALTSTALVLGAVATARVSGGFSVLTVAVIVVASLNALAGIANRARSALEPPRQEIAAAHADLQLLTAGGPSLLFGGQVPGGSEWLPR